MVRIAAEGLRDDLLEFGFNLFDGLAPGKACTIADAIDVRVDGECLFAKGRIENDVGGLSANAR